MIKDIASSNAPLVKLVETALLQLGSTTSQSTLRSYAQLLEDAIRADEGEDISQSSWRDLISRLDGELLREIALKTEGAFIPAGVASLDLEGIVQQHITPIVGTSSVRQTTSLTPIHSQFIGLALLCIILAHLMGTPLFSRTEAAVQSSGGVA